jgi:hypothetical protein
MTPAAVPTAAQTTPAPGAGRATGGNANPFIHRMGLQALLDRNHAADEAQQPAMVIDDEQALTALAGHVRAAWGRNKLAKEKIDLELLKCLRARRGVYSAAELGQIQSSNGGMNIVFTDLTETKCRAASAWIREIVLPVGEKPWGITPTPLPDLPLPLKNAVFKQALAEANTVMMQAAQAGEVMERDEFRALAVQLGEKLRDKAEKTYVKKAEKRAERMERVIDDVLAQGGYEHAMDGFVEDFVTFPAAILKGPVYQRHQRLEWGSGFKPKITNKPHQSFDRVSPFDIYPAPSARDCQSGDFIERIRFRREELWDLKGMPGYKDDEIDQALRDYTNGHLEGWLWTEAERQRLEQETLYMWLSPPGVIDAINYWGRVPGWKLMEFGLQGLEDTQEYECNVLVCGRFVLYAAINPDPMHQRPYRKACYDEIPGAFWGRSIPDLASTSQKMCNATACAMADNLSIASGPQVWIHVDRMADGEQSLEMFPWKQWQLKSDSTQGVNPGMGFFQPNDNTANLKSVYEFWEIKADDATGIPRYTYGNERAGGSADTATGLSMLMNNAAKGLRRAISSIDMNVIEPAINDVFVNEMLYNPDESIKGDNIVIPRGAAAILIRESMQQRRLQYLTIISNPLIAQALGPKYLVNTLREVAEAMELPVDDVVPGDEEFAAAQAAQAEQQQAAIAAEKEAEFASQAKLLEIEHQFDMEREAAIGAREAEGKKTDVLAELVKTAVTNALTESQAKGGDKKKKLKFNYDDAGNLIGGEEDDE